MTMSMEQITHSLSWNDVLKVEQGDVAVKWDNHWAKARGATHEPAPVDVESLVCARRRCDDDGTKQQRLHDAADERAESRGSLSERARWQREIKDLLSAVLQATGPSSSQV